MMTDATYSPDDDEMTGTYEAPDRDTPPADDLVEVTVMVDRHVHDGVLYTAGDVMRVPADMVRALESSGIAR